MKLKLVTLLIAFSGCLYSQQRVALNSNGTSTVFSGSNPFLAAYNAASHGDTIYLPGGNMPYPATIDKQLVIIGAGHHPDSSAVTSRTVLNGNLTLSEGASGTRLEGLHITGTLFTTSNHKVDDLSFLRVRIGALNLQGNRTTPCENVTFVECVIDGDLTLSNGRQISVTNSIVSGRFLNGEELGVMNSILLYEMVSSSNSSAIINNTNNSYFANNVFMRVYWPHIIFYNSSLNLLTHNVFAGVPSAGSNTVVNTYGNVDVNTFFVNQSGNSFNYEHDYNLVDPSSFSGNDGTQVGVYGGTFPLKAGFIPRNPHFQAKNIPSQTNSDGELQIQLTIEAQND